MALGRRQAIGVLGMAFAVAGGIVWFLQAHIPAILLWGVAVIILMKLNKRKARHR